jgi:tripartite-type tricarboxylate transporter receptor subunit TctC
MTPRPTRRRWLAQAAGSAAALATLGLPGAGARAATDFPSRPIALWVPWAAGGATDLSLRVLAELASEHLGQQVYTENRGGAGGTLAMPVLQQAEPDGYTIAQMPYPVFRMVHTQRVLWDPIRDVTPILQLTGVTFGLLVGANSPFRMLDDLFEYARARPGELTIATNGVGTTPHVVLEELFTARGLTYIHVPYKGTGEQLTAISGGLVMAGVNSTGFGPSVDNGLLRLLVTFADARSARWPQVPTLTDLGFDIVARSPYGLAGPRGMPRHVVEVLHDAFRKALFDPRFVKEIARYDMEVDYLGPADYARACRAIYEKERESVERMGMGRGTVGG